MAGQTSRDNGKLGGRPPGSKNQATLEREKLFEEYQRKIQENFGPLAEAMLASAQGVCHLMAKDTDGTWTEVTDPKIMLKVLNSGESFYRIYARNPDVRALKDIWDRMWGQPRQQVEMEVKGEVELVERLSRARQRGKG